MNAKNLQLVVPDDAGKQRLDKFLAENLPDLSRARLQALIAAGKVRVDGQVVTQTSHKISVGAQIDLTLPPPVMAEPKSEAIPLEILYEDEHLLVLDKPVGLVVHPAPGHSSGTLVNALLHHCGDSLSGIGGVRRPGIVHRLDKMTSGLMVVAKSDFAHQALSAQFADRSLSRTYQALVWGAPSPPEGEIIAPIGRSRENRLKMAVRPRLGKEAVTLYRVIRSLGLHVSLLECRLLSGRTHQIRVHLTHFGHGLLGDPVYGVKSSQRRSRQAGVDFEEVLAGFDRQALHATGLRFVHPATEEEMQFDSPLPADIQALIARIEGIT